jgi:hypothetical protein
VTLTPREPDPNDPDPNDPDPSDPDPGYPGPNDPDSSDPDLNDLEPNDSEPNDPDPSDPDHNEPDPRDPYPVTRPGKTQKFDTAKFDIFFIHKPFLGFYKGNRGQNEEIYIDLTNFTQTWFESLRAFPGLPVTLTQWTFFGPRRVLDILDILPVYSQIF